MGEGDLTGVKEEGRGKGDSKAKPLTSEWVLNQYCAFKNESKKSENKIDKNQKTHKGREEGEMERKTRKRPQERMPCRIIQVMTLICVSNLL